jgi:hypothetical protein
MTAKPTCLGLALCGLALMVSSPALAQSNDPTANDPSADSPSGTIYEIPLDDGRADAAPRTKGAGSGAPSSSIRSANGFSSSSQVPGTGAAAANSASGGGSGSGGGKTSGGGTGSGSGSGSPQKGSSAPTEAQATPAVVRQAAGGGSLVRSTLLIVLGLLVAAGLAAGAHFALRR